MNLEEKQKIVEEATEGHKGIAAHLQYLGRTREELTPMDAAMKLEDYVHQLEAQVAKNHFRWMEEVNAHARTKRELKREKAWNAKARRFLTVLCYNTKIYTPIFNGVRDIARTLKGKNTLF